MIKVSDLISTGFISAGAYSGLLVNKIDFSPTLGLEIRDLPSDSEIDMFGVLSHVDHAIKDVEISGMGDSPQEWVYDIINELIAQDFQIFVRLDETSTFAWEKLLNPQGVFVWASTTIDCVQNGYNPCILHKTNELIMMVDEYLQRSHLINWYNQHECLIFLTPSTGSNNEINFIEKLIKGLKTSRFRLGGYPL